MNSAAVAEKHVGHRRLRSKVQVSQPEPAALSSGTVLDVNDLYFNIPARRKFLKSEITEFAHCDEAFKRMALSQCGIEFTLQHNGKVRRLLRPASSAQRIVAILGEEFDQSAATVDEQSADMRLHGMVALPAYARASRDAQYFFVNNRYVSDKLISHALREAYRDVLHLDKHLDLLIGTYQGWAYGILFLIIFIELTPFALISHAINPIFAANARVNF